MEDNGIGKILCNVLAYVEEYECFMNVGRRVKLNVIFIFNLSEMGRFMQKCCFTNFDLVL